MPKLLIINTGFFYIRKMLRKLLFKVNMFKIWLSKSQLEVVTVEV